MVNIYILQLFGNDILAVSEFAKYTAAIYTEGGNTLCMTFIGKAKPNNRAVGRSGHRGV